MPIRLPSRRSTQLLLAVGALAFVGACAATPPPDDSSCVGDVTLEPGDDLQAAIDANPAGTRFCLAPGTYRGASLQPKTGDTIVGSGQDRTILNGANLVTSFGRSGALWYADGQTQHGFVAGECDEGYPLCGNPEILYIDDQPLLGVDRVDAVVPGAFYFDYAAQRVYFADDPRDHTVEVGSTPIALDGQRPSPSIPGGAADVTVRDLTVEKYAQTSQRGAIQTNDGWLVQHVTVRLNGGQGVLLEGNSPRLTQSRVLSNGQIGVGANGGDGIVDYGHSVNAVLVDNTEIAYNNVNHYNPGWEAGGSKFWQTKGSVIRNNWVHHNRGPGLWDDGFNEAITYDANLLEDNQQNGIFHEIGGSAVITGNVFHRNGGRGGSYTGPAQTCEGAICISSGKDIRIVGNDIVDNGRGIVLVDDPHWPDPTRDVIITDNLVADSGQAVSLAIHNLSLTEYWCDRNQYTPGQTYGFDDVERSWAEWKAYGFDPAGGVSSNLTPRITTAGIAS